MIPFRFVMAAVIAAIIIAGVLDTPL